MKWVVLWWWCAMCTQLCCQGIGRSVAASSLSTGAYSFRHLDVFSTMANLASLARIDRTMAGIYSERRYLLSELSYSVVRIVWPGSSGNVGIAARLAGFSLYRESGLGIAYARKLGGKIDLGAGFEYQNIHVTQYPKKTELIASVGAIFHPAAKTHIGLQFEEFGINHPPRSLTIGTGYEASPQFYAGFECTKLEDQPAFLQVGFSYLPVDRVRIRAGISTGANSFWLSAGIRLHMLQLELVSAYHPQLGISPGCSIQFGFARNKNSQP